MKNDIKKFKTVRGMNDILPPSSSIWHDVEETAYKIFSTYGYEEIRTPIVENTDLFVRTVGETTAIVEKEMYSFEDKGGDNLCLRPEGTASIVRAYIESGMAMSEPVARYFYKGPMFRRERPQKGRQRQFHQIGIELLGIDHPLADVEVISSFNHLLNELKIKDVQLELNSIGCSQCRPKYNDDLVKYLQSHCKVLCEDCQRRVSKNPMRAFDCKNEECGKYLKDAPKISNYWCAECVKHFEGVKKGLDCLEISYILNERIVRGLDYYVRTAFEFTTDKLGSQNAIAAGGRYDGLVKELGGPDLPGVGYAIGLERLILLVDQMSNKRSEAFYFAVLGVDVAEKLIKVIADLRQNNFRIEWDFGLKSLKAQMRRADKLGVHTVIIVGEDELQKGVATVRDMKTKGQREVRLKNLSGHLQALV